jgi:hypothetical protein
VGRRVGEAGGEEAGEAGGEGVQTHTPLLAAGKAKQAEKKPAKQAVKAFNEMQ